MNPQPPKITTEIVRLTSAIAELLIHADFGSDAGEVALAGKLMGPRCPGAETIEIAYALRGLPVTATHRRSARVVIPEPNLWEVNTPYTYWGMVEIHIDNKPVAAHPIEVGLKRP
jgi:hypothetical protein